ncbi:MAG: hypothetical protein IJE97_05510 [Thermoguttaceae bacterium]|nr:hypothetical protein [Thermoguttaceae bacterium]MBQ6826734.1 hypothetical protein [Thermoguttaceae bacterium]
MANISAAISRVAASTSANTAASPRFSISARISAFRLRRSVCSGVSLDDGLERIGATLDAT